MSDDYVDVSQQEAEDDIDEIRCRMQAIAAEVVPLVSIISGRRRADREDREAENAFFREVSFWEKCYITALSMGNSPADAAALANTSVEERDKLFDPDDEAEVVPLHVVDDEPAAEAT